jgi:hypothetical protein
MMVYRIGCIQIHQSRSGFYWIVNTSMSLWYRIMNINGPFEGFDSAIRQAEFEDDRISERGE